MRLNGARYEGTLPENSANEADDMIETENESVRERVADLEKKVLEQGDEIVCLRSTLADVLRRLSLVEGARSVTVTPSPTTPTKNGNHLMQLRTHHRNASPNNHHIGVNNHNGPPKDLRYRPINEMANSKESIRRVASYTPSSLPQSGEGTPSRRVVHYQSTGSLHSDSPSSSSVSPIPTSPSPSPTRPPSSASSKPPTTSLSMSNLHSAKRWSSTGDFNSHNHTSPHNHTSRLATNTKSLFNLHMRTNSQQNHTPMLKHGTRDATYNSEDGSLRMYLRGRPIVLYAPTPIADGYEITKVATAPHTKLKLDWVYPFIIQSFIHSSIEISYLFIFIYLFIYLFVVYLFGLSGRGINYCLLLPHNSYVECKERADCALALLSRKNKCSHSILSFYSGIELERASLLNTCIAIHPNKLLVASGQTAGHDAREGRPHIRVWNSVNLSTMAVIGIGEFERSISCLSFSKACSVDTVVAAEFHPLDKSCIVTCGKSHISFWSLDNGGTLYKRNGIFENRDKPKYVTCLAFTQTGDVLSGDSNGSIIVWGRGTNTITRFMRNVHEGSIFSICVLKEGSIITGGGKDGRLIQFDSELQKTGFEAQIAEHVGGVRTISEGRGSQLLVGSTRNCILVGSLPLGFSPAVLGHTDELWALAAHPSLSQFLTAGFDRIVQLWDCMAHSVVWSKDIAEQAQSAAFSPDGSIIIVGCVSGKWLVMDAETRELYSSHTDGSEPIQVVRYSPDGRFLALGSRDNNIYVYQVGEDVRKYSRVGRCAADRKRRRSMSSLISILGHSSFITHLDWSKNSEILRSNSGDYELLFWNPGLCRQIPQSSSLRDTEWATHTCVLSFSTVGIWPEGADGTDVNACERSHDHNLIATGDDFGKVKLYSYPACQPKSLNHTYGGHSSHVTNVTFLHDDSRLISIGGKDTSVLQWSIV
ncbi:echinoderm microtubule-associated protein-like 2 [Nilaparvata lugens]|uniref:echinoderm microtubule-associated protein-like 2 n=1 Tax=Nilaparvata lugens TaxID=108931 RepID=UPI00193DE9A9|nr:echinoderm microtubule-associated protein-like 2 [Nilaparvata lugens]